ncbi:hypothetical protein C1T14_26390, partial [Escherichia coli]
LDDGADEAAGAPPARPHIDGVGVVGPVSHPDIVPCPSAPTKVRQHRERLTFACGRLPALDVWDESSGCALAAERRASALVLGLGGAQGALDRLQNRLG